MRSDELVLTEICDAAERIVQLTDERVVDDLERDRTARDALLWNFTVPGEAVGQPSDDTKTAHPDVRWAEPPRLRNRIVHGFWFG